MTLRLSSLLWQSFHTIFPVLLAALSPAHGIAPWHFTFSLPLTLSASVSLTLKGLKSEWSLFDTICFDFLPFNLYMWRCPYYDQVRVGNELCVRQRYFAEIGFLALHIQPMHDMACFISVQNAHRCLKNSIIMRQWCNVQPKLILRELDVLYIHKITILPT